jgi:hypothetical protein
MATIATRKTKTSPKAKTQDFCAISKNHVKTKIITYVDLDNVKDNLPNTLHELLGIALKDLKAIEAKKNYKIDMNNWATFDSRDSSKCSVCMAGSVIVGTLGIPFSRTLSNEAGKIYGDLEPESFTVGKITEKLHAINCLREGDISSALEYLNIYFSNNELVKIMKNIQFGYDKVGREVLKNLISCNMGDFIEIIKDAFIKINMSNSWPVYGVTLDHHKIFHAKMNKFQKFLDYLDL